MTLYLLNRPSGPFENGYRYSYLLMPLIPVGWAALLSVKKRLPLFVSRAALLCATLAACLGLPTVFETYQYGVMVSRIEHGGVSRWVAEHLADDDIVLVHDAGYISLHGKQPLVDMVGLKTPSNIEIHRETTWAHCTGSGSLAIDRIARNSHARYFVVNGAWDEDFRLTSSLKLLGWHLERVDAERGEEVFFRVYRITPPATVQN